MGPESSCIRRAHQVHPPKFLLISVSLPAYIRSNPENTTVQCYQSTFSTGGASRRQFTIVRIQCTPKDVVVGLAPLCEYDGTVSQDNTALSQALPHHQRLGYIRTDVQDCTRLLEQLDKDTVILGILPDPSGIPCLTQDQYRLPIHPCVTCPW